MRKLVVSMISAGMLAACGGGGGDWLSFDRSPIVVRIYEGETPMVSLKGTAHGEPDTYVNIGVFVDGALFASATDPNYVDTWTRRFNARLRPLPLGTHEGWIEVRVCEDNPSTCAVPYNNSPWRIEVRVEVEPDPGHPTSPANGAFTDSGAGWTVALWSGAAANIAAANGELNVSIANGGTSNEYAIHLTETTGISLEAGRKYRFTFDARAAASRTIGAYVGEGEDRDGDRSTSIYIQPPPTVRLTTTMQTFSYEFTMYETNRAAEVNFLLGGSDHDVFIDNVAVTDVTPN